MRMRWFGHAWPSAEEPAGICDDEAYKIDTPIGKPCLYCPDPVRAQERGVVMASSWESDGGFVLWLQDDGDHSPTPRWVAACHIDCLIRATAGPDFAHLVQRVPTPAS